MAGLELTEDDWLAGLQSDQGPVVRDTLRQLMALGPQAKACVPGLVALLNDSRFVDTGNPGTPDYRPLAFLALDALVVMGADSEILKATRSQRVVTTPQACYDQGFYVGDYYQEDLSVAEYAGELLKFRTLFPPQDDGPELWNTLCQRYGAPREMRSLPAQQQREELRDSHVFWVQVNSDGYGSGDVLFSLAGPDEDVLDRGPDHLHRRWAFTFGVPFRSEWAPQLCVNPWERYSEVPSLPA